MPLLGLAPSAKHSSLLLGGVAVRLRLGEELGQYPAECGAIGRRQAIAEQRRDQLQVRFNGSQQGGPPIVGDRDLDTAPVVAGRAARERSRVSHHTRRMSARGLVTCELSAADRRVTEVTLTAQGREALAAAAPGHVDLVRRLFFGGLPADLLGPLSEALESVYANIIKQGSLPPPVDWQPAKL